MTIPVFPETKVALKGRKGLIVGIANDQSIAWGCAKAFRALGADLAVTYLNERAKKHVEPLAKELEAPIFMPLDVMAEGQTEQVFERIEKEWGQLDFLLHSIAFSPKEALHGRVVDVGRDGFLKTMDVSCWSFMRMAHLAEPLMKNGGTHVHHDLLRQPDGGGELQYHGRGEGGAGSRRSATSRPNSAPRASGFMRFRPGRWPRAPRRASPNSTS